MARRNSTSRSCSSRAYSVSRSISKTLLLRLQILVADIDQRALFDLVAHLAPCLDRLGELGEAFGVEGIRRIEEFQAGSDRGRRWPHFQAQAHWRGALPRRGRGPDWRNARRCSCISSNVICAATMRMEEANFPSSKLRMPSSCKRAAAQSLRRGGDRGFGGADADKEFGDDIDAHPIAGDQRSVVAPHHLDAQNVHVDRGDFVQHRDDESAAVNNYLFTEKSGAHKGCFLGGSAIQPAQDVDHDDDRNRDSNQPKQHFAKRVRTHRPLHTPSFAARRLCQFHLRLFAVQPAVRQSCGPAKLSNETQSPPLRQKSVR